MQRIDFMTPKPVFMAVLFVLGLQVAAAQSAPATANTKDAAPRSKAAENSVTTVDELVKIENAEALAKARAAAVASGAIKSARPSNAPTKPPPPPPADVKVSAIYGMKDSLRTDIEINGHRYPNLRGGSTAGSCEVVEVFNRCVTLRPANKTVGASQCPSTCWTGISVVRPATDLSMGQGFASSNIPMPSPIPQMSITSPPPQVRARSVGIQPADTPRGASTSFIVQ